MINSLRLLIRGHPSALLVSATLLLAACSAVPPAAGSQSPSDDASAETEAPAAHFVLSITPRGLPNPGDFEDLPSWAVAAQEALGDTVELPDFGDFEDLGSWLAAVVEVLGELERMPLQPERAQRVVLTCNPGGGTHPEQDVACESLNAARGNFEDLPHISGGCDHIGYPVQAEAVGYWGGRKVHHTEEFDSNPCQAGRETGFVFWFWSWPGRD